MAKELVKPPISELSSDAVHMCEMIDCYFTKNDVEEYSVNVESDGNVSIVPLDIPGVEFTFAV